MDSKAHFIAGHSATQRSGKGQGWRHWRAMTQGPGGLYNLGNLITLGASLGLAVLGSSDLPGALTRIAVHFAGSPEALWLSLSMLWFIVSGYLYALAFAPHAPLRLLIAGDLIAAVGAMLLTVALVLMGESTLALLGGAMLALGKLGSAAALWHRPRHVAVIDRAMRWLVTASRAPSILSLALAAIPALGGPAPMAAVMPLMMIVCFLLWLWADILLLRP